LLGLTIIHVIKSAIAAYYHLRVIVYMCMRDERYERPVSRIPAGSDVGLAISAIAMIYLDVLLG
jgi:NADH:ubiquinone oxidoreductase subunit 2 (subunit N)